MNSQLSLDNKSIKILKTLTELWELIDKKISNRTFYAMKDLRNEIFLALFASSHRIIRSIICQIEGGSIDSLENHIRPLFELVINTKYILVDDTERRAAAFNLNTQRELLRAYKKEVDFINKYPESDLAKKLNLQELREKQKSSEDYLDNFKMKEAKWPNIEQRVNAINWHEVYIYNFWLYSLDIHFNSDRIKKRLKINKKKKEINIILDQDSSRIYMNLFIAYAYYYQMLVDLNNQYDIPTKAELEKFERIHLNWKYTLQPETSS